MGLSGNERNLQIRDLRAGEHSAVLLFSKVGQNQPLPIPVQQVLAAIRIELQPASCFPRLQQQMYLRIVAQRLKMPHALHRLQQRLLVYNASGAKGDRHLEPLSDQLR